MTQDTARSNAQPKTQHEAEFTGPGWKNPYVLYIALTVGLFGFLVLMGYVAWTNGWIPSRGTSR